MLLSDVAAVILLQDQKYNDVETAKAELKAAFKASYPYWHFGDWDVEISLIVAKRIYERYENKSRINVTKLITELPGLVNEHND